MTRKEAMGVVLSASRRLVYEVDTAGDALTVVREQLRPALETLAAEAPPHIVAAGRRSAEVRGAVARLKEDVSGANRPRVPLEERRREGASLVVAFLRHGDYHDEGAVRVLDLLAAIPTAGEAKGRPWLAAASIARGDLPVRKLTARQRLALADVVSEWAVLPPASAPRPSEELAAA